MADRNVATALAGILQTWWIKRGSWLWTTNFVLSCGRMAKAIPVALKPGDDGKAWIARFVEAAGKAEKFTIFWAASEPPQLRLTDTSERPLQKLDNVITVPARGLVTVRAQR
jgi:hypothetical protein